MTRPSFFTIVAALALGATAAAAAPTPVPAGGSGTPPAAVSCPTPDEAQCLKAKYLDSACGQKHLAICRPFAQEKMKDYYNAQDKPQVKMLRPKTDQMPVDVEQGKYFKYSQPNLTTSGHNKYRSVYRKVGDELRAMQGRDMSQSPPVDRVTRVDHETAAQWHRNPEWDAYPHAKVRSCEEYAYERSYGITRFIDAASACKGDMECVFQLAYMQGSPGISDRVLRTSDGNPLPTKLTLLTGKLPKNEMFVHGGAFVRSEGLKALPGVVVTTAVERALDDGKEFYKIGSCGSGCTEPRKFQTQWDWHKFLHDKVTPLSQAEHEEYTRRLAQYRNLIEQWNAAVEWENSLREGLPELEQVLVLPLDMRAHDPFERFDHEQEYIERGRDVLQGLKSKFGNSIVNKSMPAIRQMAKQQHGSRKHTPAIGMLAAPVVPAGSGQHSTPMSTHGGATSAGNGVTGSVTKCLKDPEEWGLESAYKGPISCRIGEFLRAEWKRKEQGHKSCLDLNNFGCDWTPAMFQQSVLDKIPALDQQVTDLAYCKAWDTPTTFTSPYVPPQKEVKARLDANKAAKEEADQLIGGYIKGENSKGRKLGKDWDGGDYLGNKKLFAVGYDYDVGWAAAPQKRTGDGTSGFVCELSGSAHANTGFDAWIIDNKVSVVDGQVAGRANHDGDGQLKFAAHLEMFDQTVFSTGRDSKNKVKWKVAQTFGDDPDMGFMIEVPSFKPRFDIYVGVPVSGEMWGELMFGSQLSLSGQASSSCDASNPKLGVVAGYGPFFGAYGLDQVGVGISGIASAGVRAALNLIIIHLPVSGDMRTIVKDNPKTNGNDPTPYLRFASKLALTLGTMSGRVSLYVEFFTFDEEFELFRWKGIGPTTATLMPILSGDMAMVGFDK